MDISTDIKLVVTSIIIAVGFMTVVLGLIKNGYLNVKYALLWLTAGAVFIVLAIFPQSLQFISRVIGISIPSNTLFFFGFMAVLFILLALTVSLSLLSRENKKLSQEVAIQGLYLKEMQAKLKREAIE